MAIPESVRKLAETIDRLPGTLESDLVGTIDGAVFGAYPALRSVGYRDIPESGNPDGGDGWRWWPSAARCAELARTATGERRERLLHGMLI